MPRAVDITGRPFGRLRAIERAGQVQWAWARKTLCHCDPALGGCGGHKITTLHALRGGSARSCNCLHLEQARCAAVIGPDGVRHGSLRAAGRAAGVTKDTIVRRLSDPDSGWRRAAA